jgi:hypothetical protein
MLAECNEPSLVMALIGFGYQIVRYELALIRFSHALAHSSSLVVRHPVDAGSPRLDFARVFGEFILIFARPSFSVGQQVAERFSHHSILQLLSGSPGLRGISRRNGPDRNPPIRSGKLIAECGKVPDTESCNGCRGFLPSGDSQELRAASRPGHDHTRSYRRRLTALRRGDRATRGRNRLAASRRGLAGACGPRASSVSIFSASTTER